MSCLKTYRSTLYIESEHVSDVKTSLLQSKNPDMLNMQRDYEMESIFNNNMKIFVNIFQTDQSLTNNPESNYASY